MAAHLNDNYTQETLLTVTPWVPGKLFSLTCSRPSGFRFNAGQFARIGVPNTLALTQESDLIWRAYSMVSSPYDEYLEFFSIVVPNGAFTSHLSLLQPGDSIYIDKMAYGHLTISRFENGHDLWLFASGTGLAPFLSILHDLNTWKQFEKVILVHSVRTHNELAYQQHLLNFSQDAILSELIPNLNQRFFYQPVVTRDTVQGALQQRITHLIRNGQLQQALNIPFSLERSRFMICGNPEMVQHTRDELKVLNFKPARMKTLGEVAVENYW